MNYETVILGINEGIATVTLNRPDKLNALSPKLMDELIKAFGEVAENDSVRAVVVTGAGKAFSAGGDVKEDIEPLHRMSSSEFRKYVSSAPALYGKLVDMEKPVIAAINGYTIGAGLDLALACDIRIASEKAKFGEMFVSMGLTPEAAVYLMPRVIGVGWAKLLSFTGDVIDAKEAERIGLVERVVPHDELTSTVNKLARKLANEPTKTIGLIKRAINESLGMGFYSSLDYAFRLMYQSVHTEDHEEAVNAFLEERKPIFKGR
jgi:enoyl-CoA hydratase/carnithine racemase